MPGIRKRLADATTIAINEPEEARGSIGRGRSGTGVRQRIDVNASQPLSACSSSRGGCKSRIQSHDSEPPARDLPFNKLMRRDWAKGVLSSPKVLEYCNAASKQGATQVLTNATAGAKNAHRTMLRAMGWPTSAPPITWLDLGGGAVHPIVCPIDALEFAVANQHDFKSRYLNRCEDVGDFWLGMSGNAIYESQKTNIDINRTLAFGMHGDGAPTTKHESLFTLSFNSLHIAGSTKHTRQVYAVVKKTTDGAVLNKLLVRFAWAFNALFKGELPDVDWTPSLLFGMILPGLGK
jgi:hypothetical protein